MQGQAPNLNGKSGQISGGSAGSPPYQAFNGEYLDIIWSDTSMCLPRERAKQNSRDVMGWHPPECDESGSGAHSDQDRYGR